MDILDVMRNRSSVRAFTNDPIPRSLVEDILGDAFRAPSAMNLQPWEVHVVIGGELKRLSRRLLAAYGERRITCAPGAVRPVCEEVMSRGRECADLMTPLIASMDRDFKSYVNEGSLQFYGATVAVLVFLDEAFFPERLPDIGLFAAYLLLGAEARGVGSCPIGLVRAYEEEVKDALNVPETKTLVMAVALGRPDEGAAINRFRSPRIAVEECVRWVD